MACEGVDMWRGRRWMEGVWELGFGTFVFFVPFYFVHGGVMFVDLCVR